MVQSDMGEANSLGSRELVEMDDMILKASKEDSRELYSKLRNEIHFRIKMYINPFLLPVYSKFLYTCLKKY